MSVKLLSYRPCANTAASGSSRHDATRTHARIQRCGGGRMALIRVHGESCYGAHRLPAGETAAKRRKRGRRAGQAVKLFEDRLLLVSKALAPFVKTGEF